MSRLVGVDLRGITLLFSVLGTVFAFSAAADPLPNPHPLATPGADVGARGGEVAAGTTAADSDPNSPHHVRVWIGIAAGLAVGSFAYWVDQDQNVADWDDPNVKARFSGNAWRFDNNNLVVNFLLHPISGAGTYNLARTSHFGVPMSAGYSLLSSSLWEWVLEFKEQISINDFIVTPLGGIPIGEFFYKLGSYLDTAPRPGAGTRVAQWSLGTGVQLDRWLDGTSPKVPEKRDRLGLSRSFWHRFSFESGVYSALDQTASEHGVHRLGFRGELATVPGYLRPGRFGRFFHEADLSSLELSVEESTHAPGLELYADTMLVGYHAQAMGGFGLRGEGHAATIGSSLAYHFLDSGAHRFAERLAALHFPGLAVDWHALSRHASAVVTLRAHPDFAGVGALAQAQWQELHPSERGKAVLRNQGYFYGWGGSVQVRGEVTAGPLRLGGRLLWGKYRSQEGFERHPEKMTVDAPAEGELLWAQASVGIQPPGLPVAVGAETRMRRWDSEVDGTFKRVRGLDRGFWLRVEF